MPVILHMVQRDAMFMCFPCSVIFIRFPSHAILYMLPINSILDTFSKKRNFYTRVVSAVMCVVTFLLVMLCCIVLYCVVSYRAPGCGCPCVRSEMKSRIDSISYLYDGRKLFLMAETAQGAKMLFFDG